jgi:hypothetical protein
MSYDMSIADKYFNYTFNVSGMWYASEPEKGIRAIYGLTGEEARPILRKMRDHMENHWQKMVDMEPSNGWGSAIGAFTFLNELIIASIEYPEEFWSGD